MIGFDHKTEDRLVVFSCVTKLSLGYGYHRAIWNVSVAMSVDSYKEITILYFGQAGIGRFHRSCTKDLHAPNLLAESFKSLGCCLAILDEIYIG